MENIIKKFTLEKIAFPLAVEFEVGIQNKEQYRYYVNNCVLRRRKFFFCKVSSSRNFGCCAFRCLAFPSQLARFKFWRIYVYCRYSQVYVLIYTQTFHTCILSSIHIHIIIPKSNNNRFDDADLRGDVAVDDPAAGDIHDHVVGVDVVARRAVLQHNPAVVIRGDVLVPKKHEKHSK